MDNSIVLSVGDTYHLRSGKDRIVYAGMPSEKVYSICAKKTEFCAVRSLGICLESSLS